MRKSILDMKLRRIKYILGMIVTLSLMLSLSLSVCASSANRNEEDFAIRKVNATSLMIGTDKGFEGDKELTRAEVITIMVRMKGISEETINEFKTKDGEEPVFIDVPSNHWANPYVNVAFNLGLTEGVGEGKFNPSSPVTASEVYALSVRALNAGKLVDSERKDYSDEEWYIPYLNFANDNHLSDNVNKLFSDVCDRKTCAVIISNTLNGFLWESSKVTSGNSHKELPEVTWTESNERLFDRLGFKEVSEVTINEVDTKDKKIKVSPSVEGKNTFDAVSTLNLSGIKRGIKYTLWFDERSGSKDKDKLTGFFEEVSTSDVISFKDIKKIGTNYITVLERDNKDSENDKANKSDDEDKELKLNTLMNKDDLSKFGFDLYYNDIKQNDYTKLKENSSLSGYLIKDKDGKISKMYIEEFNYFGVIKELTDKKITFETSKTKVKGSITETISLSEDNEVIFADLKVGDGVMFHKERRSDLYSGSSNGTRYTIRKLESHSGRIKSVSTESRTVNGVKVQSVTLLGDYENGIWKLDSRINDYKVSPGDEGVFFLNQNGEIVLFAPYSETGGDFVFVTSTARLRPKYVGDNDSYELKVTTMDGKLSDWLELDFEESAKNLLGLKEWTLTEEAAKVDDLDSIWNIHPGSIYMDDENEISLSSYYAEHDNKKVYVLDRWLWDEEVSYLIYPEYSANGLITLNYNYYVFETKEGASKAAETILRKFCEGNVTSDESSLYSFFTGKPFRAKINGNKITLLEILNDYQDEWIDMDSTLVPTSSIKLISSFTNGKKYDTIKDINNNTYYLSDDAKVFLSSWNGETGYEMEITLKEADRENLENISSEDSITPIKEEDILGTSDIFAFALGADDDEREVSFIIIPERLASKKTDTELWALVLESGDTVSDKEETGSDNKNIDSFVSVIFEGTDRERTLYFDSSKFNGTNSDFATLKGLDVPRMFKFDLEGNEIKKARGNTPDDGASYFTNGSEGKQGLLAYKQGVITDIVSDTRIKVSDTYNQAEIGSAASFTNSDEHYFLSDTVIILEKEEGSDSYKILDSIYDLNETDIDTETIPTTQEQVTELNQTNLEELAENTLTLITFTKDGDKQILAIIKG